VASAELRRDADRQHRGQLGAPEVVDVVVLGDDEALPFAVREQVDRAAQLQQNRSAVERELRGVLVRDVDRARRLSGGAMAELSAQRPGRDVRDDVDLLAGVLERALEREVVVRRDDQGLRGAGLAQHRRESRDEAVKLLWLRRLLEA
jgi:hypothetical protein